MFQISPDKIFGGTFNNNTYKFTSTSTQTSPSSRAWRGVEPQQKNVSCRYCGHLQRHWTTPISGVNLALDYCKQRFRDNVVLVASDNSRAVAYIQKQGGTVSRNLSLYSLLTKTLLQSARDYIIFHLRFIPGSLNAIADSLSRNSKNR